MAVLYLRDKNAKLESKVVELGVKLKSSLDHQNEFMALNDKNTAALDKLNEDTADKILRMLEPKLRGLLDIQTKLDNINTRMNSVPMNMRTEFDRIAGLVENSNQALSEGVLATNDTLFNFGLSSDAKNMINIPDCIKILMSTPTSSTDGRGRTTETNSNTCWYSSNHLTPVFTCSQESRVI